MGDIYDLVYYAPEGPPVPGATLIPCLSDKRRQEIFGEDDQNRLYAWPRDDQTAEFNLNVIAALQKNIQPGEIILLSGGYTHFPVNTAFSQYQRVEPMCGYFGQMMTTFVGYESYSHKHQMYLRHNIENERYYDRVIHPYLDLTEFPLLNQGKGKYLLVLSRLIERKGISTAADIAKAVGLPLWVAGGGAKHISPGVIITEDNTRIECPGLKYCGAVAPKERNELMAGAVATICATKFLEPGCNVMFESLASGTPVISTDLGIFTEILPERFRFHNLRDAVQAVKEIPTWRPSAMRDYVIANFSLDASSKKFKKWFDDIETLKKDGWYTK